MPWAKLVSCATKGINYGKQCMDSMLTGEQKGWDKEVWDENAEMPAEI